MANGEIMDPVVGSWFGVEFQGQIVGAFQECTGLGSQNEVVEYKASGPRGEYIIKKVPGRMTWNNITLKRGITDAMDMWQWRSIIEEGRVEEARKNGSIVMFNTSGEEIARWDFVSAWPNKLTGPTANGAANQVAIEEMEITHEGYKRVK